MKRIKSFKFIKNDTTLVKQLLDKGEKVYATLTDDEDATIYLIKNIGVVTYLDYRSFPSESIKECYLTAKGHKLPVNAYDLKLFTGSSASIKALKKNKKPSASARSNYVGVELEFISSIPSIELMERFVNAKLVNYVTVVDDGSIEKNEDGDGYTVELKILAREAILSQVLKKVMTLIPAGSYVNRTCGLHVHLDMRNRDKDKAFTNLYKSLEYLMLRVDDSRFDNSYCELNTSYDSDTFDKAVKKGRYQAINPHSYSSYKTLEVRLKESTLSYKEVNTWTQDLIDIVNDKKFNRKGVPFVIESLEVNAS